MNQCVYCSLPEIYIITVQLVIQALTVFNSKHVNSDVEDI